MRIALQLFLFLFVLAGCSRQDKSPYSSGQARSNTELRADSPGYYLDERYAVVKTESLPVIWDRFIEELGRKGLLDESRRPRWDQRFDCNHYAFFYVTLAQIQYYRDNWSSSNPTRTLAMGVIAYLKGGQIGQGHAVVEMLTDKGMVYIEPQNGYKLTLSQVEKNSIFMRIY